MSRFALWCAKLHQQGESWAEGSRQRAVSVGGRFHTGDCFPRAESRFVATLRVSSVTLSVGRGQSVLDGRSPDSPANGVDGRPVPYGRQ